MDACRALLLQDITPPEEEELCLHLRTYSYLQLLAASLTHLTPFINNTNYISACLVIFSVPATSRS
jgi:hypothetical protein